MIVVFLAFWLPMLNFKSNHLLRRLSNSAYHSSTYNITDYIYHHISSFLSHHTLNPQSLLPSHALIIVTGNANNPYIASKLISLYASLSKPQSCVNVFDAIQSKDTFLWNSIIKSFFSNGEYKKTLELYEHMRLYNIPPNNFTIPMVVSACSEILALDCGETIHGSVAKFGLFSGNAAVGSSFVYLYSKCGQLEDACLMFDEMPIRDVVAWTALIIGHVQNAESEKALERLCEMHRIGDKCARPNFRTLEGGFQACGDLGAVRQGRGLHVLAIKGGFLSTYHLQSSVLSMYSKCGASEEAYCSFCEVGNKDIISWTAIIAVYAKLGCITECLGFFRGMQNAGIYPDEIVISCILSSFSDSMRVREAKAFHGLITRRTYIPNRVAYHALLSMYCKLGLLTVAEKLFDKEPERNLESWNMMFFGYGKEGSYGKCIDLFREMLCQGVDCDLNSFVSVISSCSRLGAIQLGISLHCHVIKNLLDRNVSISNSLIDMYGRFGKLALATSIFHQMERDTVTWNTLISAYAHQGHFGESVMLFDKMVSEGSKPNSATLVTVVSACSHLASLEKAEKIHNYIKATRIDLNLSLATALIDMYGKCGHLEKSRQIFNSLSEKDVISWNVMISCYGMHGDARSAFEIFEQMEESSVRPNGLTFLAVLSACSHAGLVEEGRYIFHSMQDCLVTPTLKHYACMVDLLGKSGNLKEAEEMVLSMPVNPDGDIWGSLLSACKIHNEVEMAMRIARHAIESDQENDGYYVIVSNMFDSIGNWEEAERIRGLMKERGVRKCSGWSAV
ncbi:hypothetical protein Ancab_007226 [Ancistrocladus abbreviatus]